jgi:hypothetical protein
MNKWEEEEKKSSERKWQWGQCIKAEVGEKGTRKGVYRRGSRGGGQMCTNY